MRNTKIVATLGPAVDGRKKLTQLISAGANVVRLNFSHGNPADHKDRVKLVRDISLELNKHVAILGDLQGPKIRIARFVDGAVELTVGDEFILDTQLDKNAGTQRIVGVDYEALVDDCDLNDRLLLDDGRIVLRVTDKTASTLKTIVEVGGTLSNNKGINKEGGGLSASALTEKDYTDIELAAELKVDYLAVSFPRSGADLREARERIRNAGGQALIVAKIERAEVVETRASLEDVISASDVVMVARGDLAVEIGDAKLPGAQKRIIKNARRLGVPVITATQMMESMIDAPAPTRAEVLDIANAVLDGTDAVMLSGETAAGKYPIEAVEAMSDIILGTEKYDPVAVREGEEFDRLSDGTDEAIAHAAMFTAQHLGNVGALATLTESGRTAMMMSRITGALPIVAFCRRREIAARLALLRNVQPVMCSSQDMVSTGRSDMVIKTLCEAGLVQPGELVIMTNGAHANIGGGTNSLRILSA